MKLHRVECLICIAERGTLRVLSPMVEKNFYIWHDGEYDSSDLSTFIYIVKNAFLDECRKSLIENIDLTKLNNFFVDATILTVEIIPSERLLKFHEQNPNVIIYSTRI